MPPPPPQPFGNLPPPPALSLPSGGPPPGRPALPRPGGYLEPAYGAGLHMPPAPPAPAVLDPGGGFGGFPETVDFGRNSAPVVVRRSGPPGIVVLLTLIAGAVGGAWVAEKLTHNAVAALEASRAPSRENDKPAPGKPATQPAQPGQPGDVAPSSQRK